MAARIIDKNEAVAVDRWTSPAVDESAADALAGARGGGAHLLTAGQLDALQRQVHEEAYQLGFEQGLTAGSAELASRAARLTALIDALARPFEDLDRRVAEELTALAVALASHLLRRELTLDATPLAAAVADCIAALPSGARELTIRVHPDDAALVREQLTEDAGRSFRLEADPQLERGDLRLSTPSSDVDGRLETRVRELIAAALNESTADDGP